MQEEIDALWSQRSGIGWSKPRENDSIWFRTATVSGYRLISACGGEMGQVATAITVSKLILQFDPILVIMIGICGGREGSGLELGDVILSSACIQYERGKFASGAMKPKTSKCVTRRDISRLLVSYLKQEPGTRIEKQLSEAALRKPRVLKGMYACADLVVKDKAKFDNILKHSPDVLAVEMESYACAYAADVLNVDFGALIMKAVSDHANKKQIEAWPRFRQILFGANCDRLSSKIVHSLASSTSIGRGRKRHTKGQPRQAATESTIRSGYESARLRDHRIQEALSRPLRSRG
jgi:nucleoside phosphorylase